MGFRIRPLVLGAALLALSLSGCNKIGFVYDFADKLLLLNLEDNFDFDKTQRARLKEDVEAYFAWHRKTMLPEYADFLQYVADSARNVQEPVKNHTTGVITAARTATMMARKTATVIGSTRATA